MNWQRKRPLITYKVSVKGNTKQSTKTGWAVKNKEKKKPMFFDKEATVRRRVGQPLFL
jgi:hypothetical protein